MSSDDPQTAAKLALAIPLRLGHICLEKVWGGRTLETVLGIELDTDGPVGESWELVDRTNENSSVRGGPFDGRQLRDLMATDREALMGKTAANVDGRFPILLKYLSATQALSVQVHPDDLIAKKLGAGDSGKTESWFIVHAEPGSLVYLGLKSGVDMKAFSTIAGGPGIVDTLEAWPVKAGQFVHVPAGALHAIGAGITLVEIQQNSDATYRLYDWGRLGMDGQPRETHLQQSLLSIRYDLPIAGPADPVLETDGGDNHRATLVDNDYYRLDFHEVKSHVQLDTGGLAQGLVLFEGSARLFHEHHEEPWVLEQGDTWLIPAVVGRYRIESTEGAAKFLLAYTQE